MKPVANMTAAMLLAFAVTALGQQTLWGQCMSATLNAAIIDL